MKHFVLLIFIFVAISPNMSYEADYDIKVKLTVPSNAVWGEKVEMSASSECDHQLTLTYTWNFGDESTPQSGEYLQNVNHTYDASKVGTRTVKVTVKGTKEGDNYNGSASADIVIMKPVIKLEKKGKTIIEEENNFSENTTIKAIVVFPEGHPNAGDVFSQFKGTITFTEVGTSCYASPGSFNPVSGTAKSGVLETIGKSLVKAPSRTTTPNSAKVKASSDNCLQGDKNPIEIPQWVDESPKNAVIDWFEKRVRAIGLGYIQWYSDNYRSEEESAYTDLGTYNVYFNPCWPTLRLNENDVLGSDLAGWHSVVHAMTAVVTHESHHCWENKQCTLNNVGINDDGNGNTPKNDDDPGGHDWAPEVVPADSERIKDGVIANTRGDDESDLIYWDNIKLAREVDALAHMNRD